MIVDRKYTGFTADYHLNPLQEELWAHKDSYDNIVVSSPTGSGKSQALTMFGLKHVQKGKAIIYTGPLKALIEQKKQDLANPENPWSQLDRTVVSGDYIYDEAKLKEIASAQIIVVTPESLLSAVRNPKGAKAGVLEDIGMILIDEVHTIGDESRGASLETLLAEICYLYPDVQLVMLSGTVINAEDFQQWATTLNGKPTTLIKSDYRPVPVQVNFIPYGSQDDQIDILLRLVKAKPEESHLIGVHAKRFGNLLLEHLQHNGFPKAGFHCADRTFEDRRTLENDFISRKNNVLVCTSTLFAGMNLPATNVHNSSTTFGMDQPVATTSLQQLQGRAGRLGYDEFGVVNHLVRKSIFQEEVDRITNGEPVLSTMHSKHVVASHLLGAIYMERIGNRRDFANWYARLLAHVQRPQLGLTDDDKLLDTMVDDLVKYQMLRVDEHGNYKILPRGRICASMMFSPYQFMGLLVGFNTFFAIGNPNDTDLARAFAFNSAWETNLPKSEAYLIRQAFRASVPNSRQKTAETVMRMLTKEKLTGSLLGLSFGIKRDVGRVCTAIARAMQESEKEDGVRSRADKALRVRAAGIRVKDGVTWEVAMKQATNVLTKADMVALKQVGLESLDDIIKNPTTAATILSEQKLREIGILAG